MKELYYSGLYRVSSMKGLRSAEEPFVVKSIRLLSPNRDRIDSMLINSAGDKDENSALRDKAMQETLRLPDMFDRMVVLHPQVMSTITELGFSVVASMQTGRNLGGGEVVQVSYPRMYRDLFDVPENARDDIAYGLAVSFLRAIPFGEHALNIPLPTEEGNS